MTRLADPPSAYRHDLMGSAWNPWQTLRGRPDVALVVAALPDHTGGAQVAEHGGRYVVTIDPRLGQAARNEALAHELTHVERGLLPADAPDWLLAKEEARVRRLVAQRLVDSPALARLVEVAEREGWALEAADLLDELGMPHDESSLALLAEVWP